MLGWFAVFIKHGTHATKFFTCKNDIAFIQYAFLNQYSRGNTTPLVQ